MTRVPDAARRRLRLVDRVLDPRRLAYLSGGGDRDGVLAALAGYATPDGGNAFALEPDVKGSSRRSGRLLSRGRRGGDGRDRGYGWRADRGRAA
ncbi:hypothetical protein OHA21_05775 [Actinoplanes sp. NBC_00393]|uniref:hypothetical protein n=1 Tax=Actinoplanes sp. NBC_00393 TaxID=2975953 RepID=UPI002E1D8DC2